MGERLKKVLRLGVALGIAGGGAVQTGILIREDQQIAKQNEEIKKVRQELTDTQKQECFDNNHQNFLDMALRNLYGVEGSYGFKDCDKDFPNSNVGDPRRPVTGAGG